MDNIEIVETPSNLLEEATLSSDILRGRRFEKTL